MPKIYRSSPTISALFLLGLTALGLFLLPRPTFGQYLTTADQVIEVDTVMGVVKTTLPFDKPFILKKTTRNGQTYKGGAYFLLGRHREWFRGYAQLTYPIRTMTRREYARYVYTVEPDPAARPQFMRDHPRSTAVGPFNLIQEGTDYVVRNQKGVAEMSLVVPPLEPKNNYAFIFFNTPSTKEKEKLYGIVRKMSSEKDKALTEFQTFADSKNKVIADVMKTPFSYFLAKKGFEKIYGDSLEEHVVDLDLKDIGLKYQLPVITSRAQRFAGNDTLRLLIAKAGTCACTDQLHHSRVCKQAKSLLIPSASLYHGLSAELVGGMRSFYTKVHEKSVGAQEYSKRTTTLKATIDSLAVLTTYADLLLLEGYEPAAIRPLRAALIRLSVDLTSYATALKAAQTVQERIVGFLDNDVNFRSIERFYNSTTSVYNFKTRGKFSITPDFGFIGYGSPRSLDKFKGLSPYIGVHLNFRYIDKDIPYRNLANKTLAHRLSFNTGWTLVSLSDGVTRDDFFKKSALVTGLGFRLSNAIRLTGGTLWLKEYDTNPLLAQTDLAMVPYAGVSIDLELVEFLKNITGTLGL